MIRTRTTEAFDDWLTRSQNSKIPELVSFVNSLRADYAAVKAALSRPESNAHEFDKIKVIHLSTEVMIEK